MEKLCLHPSTYFTLRKVCAKKRTKEKKRKEKRILDAKEGQKSAKSQDHGHPASISVHVALE